MCDSHCGDRDGCEEAQLDCCLPPRSDLMQYLWRLLKPSAPVSPSSSFIRSVCLSVTVRQRQTQPDRMSRPCSSQNHKLEALYVCVLDIFIKQQEVCLELYLSCQESVFLLINITQSRFWHSVVTDVRFVFPAGRMGGGGP